MRFEMGSAELALMLVILLFAFGGTWLPGLREIVHAPRPPGQRKTRWSRSDWALLGAAVVAMVVGLLALGLHRR